MYCYMITETFSTTKMYMYTSIYMYNMYIVYSYSIIHFAYYFYNRQTSIQCHKHRGGGSYGIFLLYTYTYIDVI